MTEFSEGGCHELWLEESKSNIVYIAQKDQLRTAQWFKLLGSSRITHDGYFQPIRCEWARDTWGDVCGPIGTQSDDVIIGPEYCIHARPPWPPPVPKSVWDRSNHLET